MTKSIDTQMLIYRWQSTEYLSRLKESINTENLSRDISWKISYILECREKWKDVLLCQWTCWGWCWDECINIK